MRRVILLTPLEGEALAALLRVLETEARCVVVRDADALGRAMTAAPAAVLVAYGTGVIVPSALLGEHRAGAWNFHGAPPEYPGRDPHHFACYDGVTRYGATAHAMTAAVDAGPIVGVERCEVPAGSSPAALLDAGNRALFVLFERLAPAMARGEALPPLPGEHWGPRKTSRADFRAMTRLSPIVDAEEFARRFEAFDGGVHDNLTVELFGWPFRIDKAARRDAVPDGRWTEFTEEGYRRLLALARAQGYAFADYRAAPPGPHVLWRHDVDLSMHRARRLAALDAEAGVVSTFFLNPHCAYYNLLEPAILALVREILGFGHRLGLHFDAEAYPGEAWTAARLEACLGRERRLLQDFVHGDVDAVSWHNPDVGDLLRFDADRLGGMVNCYSARLRGDYTYASDSNGFWRHAPIGQRLTEGHPRLHVLTHPEWWTPEPLAPRERVDRCVLGRARAVGRSYDAGMTAHARPNLRGGEKP